MQAKPTQTSDVVEFRASRGEASIAVMMNRSLAEVQRRELEAEGWNVEVGTEQVLNRA